MAQATGQAIVKRALVNRWKARAGLAGVVVGYAPPTTIPELQGPAGSYENIHFAAVDGDIDNVVFCNGSLVFDETYIQPLRVQVLRTGSRGTVERCELRVGELLNEIWQDLAAQEQWDLAAMGLTFLDNLLVTPSTQEWTQGRLGGTAKGNFAGVEIGLKVEARRSYA